MPGAPGMPGEPMPMGPGPDGQMANPLDPNTMAGSLAATQQTGMPPAPPEVPPAPMGEMATTAEPQAPGQLSAEAFGFIETKEDSVSLQRWTEILNRAFERVIERQQRVTLEKVNGVRSRKALASGNLSIDTIFNVEIWDKQLDEDIRPVLSAIVNDSKELSKKSLDGLDVVAQLNSQLDRFKAVNETTFDALTSAYISSLPVQDETNRSTVFKAHCVAIFSNLLARTVSETASVEARRSWQFAN